jgi:hypothetical protein
VKLVDPLDMVLRLSLLAVLAGAESFTNIAKCDARNSTFTAWSHGGYLRRPRRRTFPAQLRRLISRVDRAPSRG